MKRTRERPRPAPRAAGPKDGTSERRRRAETRLRTKGPAAAPAANVDVAQIVRELQVHRTELKMQNDELEAARAQGATHLAQYASLYEFAPVGYVTLDRDGAIRMVNLTTARLLGVGRQAIVQRRFGVFVAEHDRPVFRQFLRRVFTSRAQEWCDVAIAQESGAPLVVRIEGSISEDGLECRVALLDVTTRKRAEQELQESEQRFWSLFEGNRDAMLILEPPSWNVTLANPAALEMFRAENEDELRAAVFTPTQPERQPDGRRSVEVIDAELEAALRDGSRSFEFTCRRIGGAEFLATVLLTRLQSSGEMLVQATIRDISESRNAENRASRLLEEANCSRQALLSVVEDERAAEAELSRLNAELEQRVLSRTAELTAANVELDSFAYTVSHDLRGPLRAMSGFSVAMLEDYGEQLPEGARGYLDHIRQAAQAMGELIEGLIVLSRSTRGELLRGPVDVSATARGLCQELARANPARPVHWQVEDGLTAWADPRMLDLVLRNLLDNAWKYTGNVPAPSIRVHAEVAEGERVFCVTDNGAGFDMRHADRLFKPFQRLHRPDEFPGIGIGLTTVQRVVLRHGGTVSATAAVGQGATFRFSLPDPGMGAAQAP